jgi:adenosylcobinamide-GDP ribazoletransferase
MFRSLIAAFSMFSRIPMPKIRGEGNARYMMCFFPLVGVVLGGVVWCGFSILSRSVGEARFLTAAILTVLPILITGGIHMDGWMDTHDAIHSWKGREERLAILKDPHVGAFAVISAIGYMLLTVAGFTEVTAGTIGVVAFVLTFGIYMSNAENKLIYDVVRPFLTKHYDKQARDRRI